MPVSDIRRKTTMARMYEFVTRVGKHLPERELVRIRITDVAYRCANGYSPIYARMLLAQVAADRGWKIEGKALIVKNLSYQKSQEAIE